MPDAEKASGIFFLDKYYYICPIFLINTFFIMNKKIKSHLAKYKNEVLKIKGNGIWKNNRRPYRHILPEKSATANLIKSGYLPELLSMYEHLNDKGEIHDGFHHLNSSQAMCINLFMPLVVENIVDKFLGNVLYCEFEKTMYDKSSIDFFAYKEITTSVEAKYSEKGFGGASRETPCNRWDNPINGHDSYKDSCVKMGSSISKDDFFKNYQLYRNLILALDPNHITYFVFPKFRNDLANKVDEAKKDCHNVASRVKVLYVDDIVNEILKGDYSQKLKDHFTEFRTKYLEIKN